MTKKELKEWNKWLATRPKIIQKLAKQLPPDKLYKLKSTGHIVTLYSYDENGTVKVNVTRDLNPRVLFERQVFGLKPKDLIKVSQ